MEVGDPEKVRYPASVALPISLYVEWLPHRGRSPGQPRRGSRLAGVSFLHVNAGVG